MSKKKGGGQRMEFLQTLLDSLTGLLAAYPLAGEWYMAFVRFLFPALRCV